MQTLILTVEQYAFWTRNQADRWVRQGDQVLPGHSRSMPLHHAKAAIGVTLYGRDDCMCDDCL